MKMQAASAIACAWPEPVRPLRWWTAQQLGVVNVALVAARMAWRQAWIDDAVMSSDEVTDVAITPGHGDVFRTDLACRCWRPLYAAPDEMEIWIAGGHVVPTEMFAILFGMPSGTQSSRAASTDGMTADLAHAAWEGLLQHIQQAFSVNGEACSGLPAQTVTSLPAEHFLPWSGALHVVLPLRQELSVLLHIAPGRVAACSGNAGAQPISAQECGDRAQLIAVEQAIASRPERVHAMLTPVDITLGQLQSLRVGDVLLLPHSLEQRLQVQNDQAMTLCHAHLGQVDGQRALALIRNPMPDKT